MSRHALDIDGLGEKQIEAFYADGLVTRPQDIFALERRENWSLMAWLIPQRFGYRQVMYYVVIKAIVQALRGPHVGWTSIARSGRVHVRAS